jgi:ABC-type Zn uptake system ZnuABC Zn-binding protein ZnuA
VSPLHVLAILLVAAAAAGCGREEATGEGAVRVVATTGQLADFARQVGAERVRVDVLVPPRADPHDFEPRPSDADALSRADVVLRSGGDLDDWLGDVIDAAGGDAAQVTLGDGLPGVRRGGDADPHWWQDPRNVLRAVERIRAALVRADPAGRDAYARAARAYARRVRTLDAAIARCLAGVPAERRKLVTTHDAFGHFARRYGIAILGSVVPALSSAAQPSAGEVRRLVAAIRRERVATIFPERALGRGLERAVAREAGARVGPPLYADALGEPGSPGATYLGALRHDAGAIAAGLGARGCRLPA